MHVTPKSVGVAFIPTLVSGYIPSVAVDIMYKSEARRDTPEAFPSEQPSYLCFKPTQIYPHPSILGPINKQTDRPFITFAMKSAYLISYHAPTFNLKIHQTSNQRPNIGVLRIRIRIRYLHISQGCMHALTASPPSRLAVQRRAAYLRLSPPISPRMHPSPDLRSRCTDRVDRPTEWVEHVIIIKM